MIFNDENTGYIHSYLSGGTVDGPGIRFVLFMQTCPLRCRFCHNPDTWYYNENNKIDVQRALKLVLQYKDFYFATNGGITVSGGEPLMQPKFVLNLFKKLKEYNIHTCIDTSGYVDITKNITDLIEYTDLFLLDIKHTNNEEHIKLTGKPNIKVINFLNALLKHNKKIWIRQVIMPSVTDSSDYAESLINLIEPYRSIIDKVELLPYHTMGKDKWEKLNLKYTLDINPPDSETLRFVKDKIEKNGYSVILS